jgi:hypothetical protein
LIAFVHAVSGSKFGRKCQQLMPQHPARAFTATAALGILSHFVLDAIPHLDPSDLRAAGFFTPAFFWVFVVADSLAAIIYTWLRIRGVCWDHARFILFGAFCAWVPDVPGNMPIVRDFCSLLPGYKKYMSFHLWAHSSTYLLPMSKYAIIGFGSQIIMTLAFWMPVNVARLRLVPRPPGPGRAIPPESTSFDLPPAA